MNMKKVGGIGQIVALYPYNVGTELPRSVNMYLKAVGARLAAVKPRFSRRFEGTFLDTLNTSLGYQHIGSDCYIIEDAEVLFTAPLIKRKSPEATVIYYFADHQPAGHRAYSYDFENLSDIIRFCERSIDVKLIRFILQRYIDGVITNSAVAADIIQQTSAMPVGIAPTYVPEDIYDQLLTIEPSFESNTAVTVARGVDTKGVDMLVEAWREVRDKHPDSRLKIIGPGHDTVTASIPGIEYFGHVDHEDLPGQFTDCSLFIQPSRFDTFATTALEGMCAGLPTLVTNMTGAAGVVENVDDSLITQPSAVELASSINTYFSTSLERRKKLCRLARSESQKYTKAAGIQRFESELKRVCRSVQ